MKPITDLPFLNPIDPLKHKSEINSRVPFNDPLKQQSTIFYPEWTTTQLFD